MTGTAYKRSAELAGVVGPYDGYARNADAHKRVMRKHAAANDAVRTVDADRRATCTRAATKAWAASASRSARRTAGATRRPRCSRPTGTIGFMMDCDTTGIEPDFALVKFKKLVGGGSMQIVNQTVPRALRKLGYHEETIEAIVEYIAEHGHVIDAPGLKPEHYEVFDCAMGERVHHADGPRADDGGGPAVPVRRDLQDGQPAGDGDGRGDRGRLLPGLEARPQGARGLPRQLQGRPAAVRRQGPRRERGRRAVGETGRRVPPDPQAPAEVAPVA